MQLNDKSKLVIKICLFIIGVIFNIWGLLSLAYVNEWVNVEFLGYLDDVDYVLVKYVILIATIAVGIMTFSITATTLKGKAMRGLVIGVTTYSTILTIPLLLSFIFFIVSTAGTELPIFLAEMLDPIAQDFYTIFKTPNMIYTIFSAGILMSIIFLAVPIVNARMALRRAHK